MDGNGLADSIPSPVEANEPTHKIFEGIPLTDGISPAWHFARDRNTSVSTDGVAKGGTAIATKTADPASAIIAAEWQTDQVAVGPRMMIMLGAREPAENEGIGASYGGFNLTEIGQIAFLNSISHYAGPWGAKHLWATFEKDLGEVDSAPGGQDVTLLVKNLGLDETVTITNLSFSGIGAEFYTVKSAPESIAPTEVAEIVITLDTQGNTGSFDASLVIESDSTMESIRSRSVAFKARALNFAGPAVHYTLDETAGEEILDVTGNERHAMATTDVDLTAESLIVFTLESDFTWSFWVNADETSNNNIVIGNRYMSDGNDFGPREFVKFTPSKFEWHFNAGGENAPDTPLVVGQWDHNLVVKSGASLTYYRNGEVIAEGTITGAPTNAQPFYIGGQPSNAGDVAENFSGLFDEVAVFSRALSPDEVSQAYQLGLAGQALVSVSDPGPTTGLDSLTDVSIDADGNFSFTLPEGDAADIEYSQDLINWEVISNGVSGAFQDSDADRKARPAGFYRGKQ